MKIFFSVGEPSGDLHGANLIAALKRRQPDLRCVGYGGPRMAAAGCELHEDLTQLSVMWLLRVLVNLDKFWNLLVRADRYFRRERPDAVVLIDYPGFNWWIARRAKACGIPVYYYGTPQIWAWARWRVRKMRRLVDLAFCKLPFEEEWLRRRGCRARYVGHPYFDQLSQQRLDDDFLCPLLADSRPLVTILPGSRTQEVEQNLHHFLKAASHVHARVPSTRFAVASFNEKQARLARQAAGQCEFPVEVHVGRTPELIHAATCCMACSGSVSLELLYHLKPTVIHYRISPTAYQVQKCFRKVKYITLVNLLAADDPFDEDLTPYDPAAPGAEKVPFPEYLTCEDKSREMADHVTGWLTDREQLGRTVAVLKRLKEKTALPGASERAAGHLIELLGQRAEAASPVARPHFLPARRSEAASRDSSGATAGLSSSASQPYR